MHQYFLPLGKQLWNPFKQQQQDRQKEDTEKDTKEEEKKAPNFSESSLFQLLQSVQELLGRAKSPQTPNNSASTVQNASTTESMPVIENVTETAPIDDDKYCDGINLEILQMANPSLACCAKMVIYDSRLYSCVESEDGEAVTTTIAGPVESNQQGVPKAHIKSSEDAIDVMDRTDDIAEHTDKNYSEDLFDTTDNAPLYFEPNFPVQSSPEDHAFNRPLQYENTEESLAEIQQNQQPLYSEYAENNIENIDYTTNENEGDESASKDITDGDQDNEEQQALAARRRSAKKPFSQIFQHPQDKDLSTLSNFIKLTCGVI